jgi:hypothetical protein
MENGRHGFDHCVRGVSYSAATAADYARSGG